MDAHSFIKQTETELRQVFEKFDIIESLNTQKILEQFKSHSVSARHFSPTTGYGYDDIGRDTLSDIYAAVLGVQSAVVRPQITCGTHALSACLFGILRPGDTLVSAVGRPYDTLGDVIGLSGKSGMGSLKDMGVNYRQAELKDGKPNKEAIKTLLDGTVKLVLVQRSRGYDWRASLSVKEINDLINFVHENCPGASVMIDNCYGEFTDTQEPAADIMAGSLIKNPGGGLAPAGGYIAGKTELVEKVCCRLTCPGLGGEVGSYAGSYRPFYQGLFMAPHTVNQTLKTLCLFSKAFEKLGYEVHPKAEDARNDIIQAIKFRDKNKLIRFMQLVQANSPVDSEAVPEPWDMPGYQDQVIMAAGTFVAGASIELSADAPIREPFTAYMQGGLSFAHGKIVLEAILSDEAFRL
ncbi:MAG: methionine gamma-lyase family protein [Clostridiales bacterium]|nr:methionine gamma-lyase family protein [Clostridiales bacterium]